MKILLATDGSPFSIAALREVVTRPWPADTEVRVVSVVHALPFVPEPTFVGIGLHYQSLEIEQRRAAHAIDAAKRELAARAPNLRVSTATVEGAPARYIVDEAARWGADLIIVGSHGHGAPARLVLGSVSHAVVLHAPCSVEVVRDRSAAAPHEAAPGVAGTPAAR